MFVTAEREVHWRARPRDGWSAGTGMWRVRVFWPFVEDKHRVPSWGARTAYLCAPDAECYCTASAIANFLSK